MLHSAAELGSGHGGDQLHFSLQNLRQVAVRGTVAQEVGSHGDQDPTILGFGQQPINERSALRIVLGEGEEFLELVCHQHSRLALYPPQARFQLGQWIAARRHVGHLQAGFLFLERWNQPG